MQLGLLYGLLLGELMKPFQSLARKLIVAKASFQAVSENYGGRRLETAEKRSGVRLATELCWCRARHQLGCFFQDVDCPGHHPLIFRIGCVSSLVPVRSHDLSKLYFSLIAEREV